MIERSSSPWVASLSEVGPADLPRVGGKGANLGALVAAGLDVPPGFCVTTAAFDAFMGQDPGVGAMLEALDELPSTDVEGVRERAGALREHLRGLPVPPPVAAALHEALAEAGLEHAYAVRSSATLEDLPDASFAGQQDTYLEVRGGEEIERRVRDGWVSLFTDRAVLYRRQQGFASHAARLAVVVQRMVRPEVSGILFTADPVTGHRGVCSIDASYGLGEALVSGRVNADLYRVERATGALLELRVGAKEIAIWPLPEGGTELRPVPPEDRERRCLDERQLAELLHLGETVEAMQGQPQDIEWCIEDGQVFLVQARAITSLFPIPQPAPPSGGLRVYMSFGHVQVNTAPLPPMARSVAAHLVPFFKPSIDDVSPMVASAGGRVFFDFTAPLLRWPLSRIIPLMLTQVERGIGERLRVVRDRPAFRVDARRRALPRRSVLAFLRLMVPRVLMRLWWAPPERATEDFERTIETTRNDYLERFTRAQPGAERLRVAIRCLGEVFPGPLLDTQFPILMAGMAAWRLLPRLLRGRVSVATIEALSRGLRGNVTTEMDLELGDLADRARGVPAVVAGLRSGPPRTAIQRLRTVPEAEAFLAAWDRFIARYGHRGPGEIDVTVPRWGDDPSSLVTSLVGIIGDAPGAHRRRHEAAVREAEAAQAEILEAAGGGLRGRLIRRFVRCVRSYLALREHGKYLAMVLFEHTRTTVLEAGAIAVSQGRLERAEDAWLLTLEELVAMLEGAGPGAEELERRRVEERGAARLVPPRVITSEGEQPPLPDAGPLPPGELAGLAASAGTVEGVARVVLDPATQVLEAGEILVAPFTDPGWTPLFVHAGGLVMEIGGLMTHGSVVAREYGLPAVVGVDGATTRIRSGQRIRVDGDRGRVVLLDELASEQGTVPAPRPEAPR